MKLKKYLIVFDYTLFLSVMILSVIGLLFIYSANLNNLTSYAKLPFFLGGGNVPTNFIKQLLFLVIGLSFLVAIQFFSLRRIKYFGGILYVICIIGLLLTLFFPLVKGQRRFELLGISIQFSEFMKIAVIMVLSDFLTNRTKEELNSIKVLGKALLIVLAPLVLIMLQPDLGTGLVFLPIFLAVCFFAGVNLKYIVSVSIVGLIAGIIPITDAINKVFFNGESDFFNAIQQPYFLVIFFSGLSLTALIAFLGSINIFKGIGFRLKKFFFYYSFYALLVIIGFVASYIIEFKLIADYQKDRIIVFLNPEHDPDFRGYHVIQSKIAIGNGGLFGKGWTKGDMSQNDFIPERDTDFIYAVVAEEMGFVGSLLLIVLFSIIIIRSFVAVSKSRTYWGGYVVMGILSLFIFHILQNIGMCIGLMPITGIPLPFISYGGTFLITCLIGTGIIIKIQIDKYEY